ncbi:MAG: endonuclease/exonuclease/phosphatase family protein [Bacteroidota bacterium]
MRRIFLVAFLSLCYFHASVAQENRKSLRVITYNIWNGFDWGKDTLRHHKFIEWVSFQNPDVLALQELCGYTQSKLERDAKAWGHSYALILKEDGYPVGITSKWPITLKGKHREGMWHGMLHVQSAGIDFFVVHLSPADWKTRKREAYLITQHMDSLPHKEYLVLGDFNALSPMDEDLNREKRSLLARYKTGDANNETYQNLRHGYWDYTAMSIFFASGLIDVSIPFVSPSERFSFPAPALMNIWQTASEIKRHRHRIDYILASPTLAKQCVYSRILNSSETGSLSDHYPVVADFIWP